MAGFYSGKEGELLIDGDKAARVRSWSFSMNQSVLETVSLEDTDRNIINGIRSYTGSASIYYYQETAGGGSGKLTTLINKIIKPSETAQGNDATAVEAQTISFRLRIKDGSVLGRFIEFQAIVTSVSMTSTVGEVTAADLSFECKGAPSAVAL